jgi:hypothetical protein
MFSRRHRPFDPKFNFDTTYQKNSRDIGRRFHWKRTAQKKSQLLPKLLLVLVLILIGMYLLSSVEV